jgi:hypothetical protein
MLTQDIRELLHAPNPADPTLFLERLDATLTAGYAHALQLEAERWRLERRIGEVASSLGDERDERDINELADLGRGLTSVNESVATLRTLLTSLRDRRSQVRSAA